MTPITPASYFMDTYAAHGNDNSFLSIYAQKGEPEFQGGTLISRKNLKYMFRGNEYFGGPHIT